MELTPLQEALRGQTGNSPQAKAIAHYRGAESASRFTDPQQEFTALLRGCGIYDLGFRARVLITGSDRQRWLNGMVTNNIRDLAVGHGVYAFLLNPQGRILGDMWAFNRGESLIVETDRSQVEQMLATFDHYIIMDDVEAKEVSGQQTALGLSGPRSRGVLNAVGIEVPELQPLQIITPSCACDCDCMECTVVRGDNAGQESYEIWLDAKDVLKTWQALLSAGATAVGSEALEMQRIASGIPLYGVDIRDRDLPQETEQTRALNFSKGCYVGQEIVERIRSRGNVHRKFSVFMLESSEPVVAGTKIISGDKEVGEVTSSAVLGTSSGLRTIAVGYLRREVAVPGREVVIGTARGSVVQLPVESIRFQSAEDAVLHKV